MGKLICVWGIPYSGKTFLSVKLSERLSREKHGLASVMTVMTDMYTPSLPVIFPSYPPGEIFSLGEVTQRGSVSWDGILSGTVLVRGKRSSGVLGYAHGENMYSYPAYDADTANGILDCISKHTDYTVVDCTGDVNGSAIAAEALKRSDVTIYCVTPEMRSNEYISSVFPLQRRMGYLDSGRIFLQVMDCVTPGMELNGVRTDMTPAGPVRVYLPYSPKCAAQSRSGALWERTDDRRMAKAIEETARCIID